MATETTIKKKSVFETLSSISVAGKVEKIGKLSYLSWAYAWGELKKAYPSATYTIYENKDGLNYHTDGRTCWVKTGVTVEGLEHIEYLPVMDNMHKSIPLERVTSFAVNTAIQRSLTKACARHGLGLAVYAGEDLPEPVEYKPVAEDTYWQLVAAAAEKRKTKGGADAKAWWMEHTFAGAEQVTKFEEDVYNYKVTNNIK